MERWVALVAVAVLLLPTGVESARKLEEYYSSYVSALRFSSMHFPIIGQFKNIFTAGTQSKLQRMEGNVAAPGPMEVYAYAQPPPAGLVPVSLPIYSTLAQAPAPGPAAAPPPPSNTCPPTPGMCQFYFEGYESSLPYFTIVDGVGDLAVSPPITTSVRGSSIVDVVTAHSSQAEYICQDGVNVWTPPPSTFESGTSPDNQFYVNQVKVLTRTFQPATGGTRPYHKKYVRLNLTNVELNMMTYITNLNPGDNSQYFPEERRCVVFGTN